jgi:dTDP-D-glucose 4,6-dehydratase
MTEPKTEEKATAAKTEPEYRYVVTEPCHRDGLYYVPAESGEEDVIHVATEPQVSKALKPADKFTAAATEEKRKEFEAVKRKQELAAHPELAKLVEQNALLQARLELALGALEKAAAKK